MTDGQTKINNDPDNLEYFAFEGVKGMNSEMTDHHDGTFTIPTCQPSCRLKEQSNKKIIEYNDPEEIDQFYGCRRNILLN